MFIVEVNHKNDEKLTNSISMTGLIIHIKIMKENLYLKFLPD